MFLLHRRLGGVDGFADAAQLEGEDRGERKSSYILDSSFIHSLNHVLGLIIHLLPIHES